MDIGLFERSEDHSSFLLPKDVSGFPRRMHPFILALVYYCNMIAIHTLNITFTVWEPVWCLLAGTLRNMHPPAPLSFVKLSLLAHFYYFCSTNLGLGEPRRKSKVYKQDI